MTEREREGGGVIAMDKTSSICLRRFLQRLVL